MKTHNKLSNGTVFIILLIIVSFILLPHNNLYCRIINDFNLQITFALLTAILTTSLFNFYNSLKNYYEIKKYKGYWMVFKFNNENYTKLEAYVHIEIESNNTLSYYYCDLKSIDEIVGTIYINKNNKNTGKLISRFEWCNQESKLYPINEYSVFFDYDTDHLKKSTSVIRIMHLNGIEYLSLIRAENQSQFKQDINSTYCETCTKMCNHIINLIQTKEQDPSTEMSSNTDSGFKT